MISSETVTECFRQLFVLKYLIVSSYPFSGFSLGPTSPLARGNSAKYHGPNTMPSGQSASSTLSSAISTSTLNGDDMFVEPAAAEGAVGKAPTRGDSMRESMKARLDRLVSASALDLTDEEVENTTDLAMLY